MTARLANQCWYKRLKILQVILAIGIPIASHADPEIAKWLTSIAGRPSRCWKASRTRTSVRNDVGHVSPGIVYSRAAT
jgi:hypothetical protein